MFSVPKNHGVSTLVKCVRTQTEADATQVEARTCSYASEIVLRSSTFNEGMLKVHYGT
jgi:hypothetical protein